MDMPAGSRHEPNPLLVGMAEGHLQWIPEAGAGYLEVRGEHYDQSYFDNYRRLAGTEMSRSLTSFRMNLVDTYSIDGPPLVDVGIGDGAFLEARVKRGCVNCFGFDVNPVGIAWLKGRGLWADLYGQRWETATFWDSLEHIRDPSLALVQVSRTAIVSLPIFSGPDHVLSSKHYKPAEHYWYFTRDGFVQFVEGQGFGVANWSQGETLLGREGIETFVLRRRA